MSQFGRKFDEALDRHITGNYGENQFDVDYDKIIEANDDLRQQLRQDILDRYDNWEYWNQEIVEDWINENDEKLKQIRDGEK
tara:strand:- start:465 stop:710 length:246 start_codon:yes stop_codon:yes gene_type:complete